MNTPVKRHCLRCTACCEGWLSAKIQNHVVNAGNPCPFSSSNGCSIYTSRPDDPCMRFICSWLVDSSPLPEWMRPDLCGAIVLLNMPWQDIRVIKAIPVGSALPKPTLEWLKNYAVKYKRPLLYHERLLDKGVYSGLKRFGYGPPDFLRLVAQLMDENAVDLVGMQSS